MYRPDEYLALVVGMMFLAGIALSIQWVRRRSRLRRLMK